ncbi:zinc finger (CCCH type) motif-containing protein [Besnoitia besnoiti]|uniref:Zinc finger (CCCH type) motif-containing protein n=1 Tax=Besnoitia besnoiti TaxID=94643 RepID=A0A2A9MNH9_BESBE|nr:zinc finger (CCCH type) motif-containing protein [Besnoitia besnoiti]PFH37463.1 zinc finger (CCCH type) motif-containing protein [Besnoitia besnoiti]
MDCESTVSLEGSCADRSSGSCVFRSESRGLAPESAGAVSACGRHRGFDAEVRTRRQAPSRFVCETSATQERSPGREDGRVETKNNNIALPNTGCASEAATEHRWAKGTAVNSQQQAGEVRGDAMSRSPAPQSTEGAARVEPEGERGGLVVTTPRLAEGGGCMMRRCPSAPGAMSSLEQNRLLEQQRLQVQVLHLQRKVILQEQMLLQQQQVHYSCGGGRDLGSAGRVDLDAAASAHPSYTRAGKDDSGKSRRGRNESKGGGRNYCLTDNPYRAGKSGGPPVTDSGHVAGVDASNRVRTVSDTRPKHEKRHVKARSGSAGEAELREYAGGQRQSGRRAGDEGYQKDISTGPSDVSVGDRPASSPGSAGFSAQEFGASNGGRCAKDVIYVCEEPLRDLEDGVEGIAAPSAARPLGQGGRVGNRCRAQSDFTDGTFKKKGGRMEDQFFRIKLCPKYMRGLCRKGARCSYAHAQEELRDVPNLWKTKLCTAYRLGKPCSLEASCPYAHGEEELRSTADYYKTKLCKFWMREGRCDAGKACRHAHGDQELRKRNYRHTELEKFALRHHLDMRQLLDEFRTGRVPAAIQELVCTSGSSGTSSGGGRGHVAASPSSAPMQSAAYAAGADEGTMGRPRFFSFTASCVERKPRSISGESITVASTAATGRGAAEELSCSSDAAAVGAREMTANGSTWGAPGPAYSSIKQQKGSTCSGCAANGAAVSAVGSGGEAPDCERRGGNRGGVHSFSAPGHGHHGGTGRGGRQRHGQHFRNRFDNQPSQQHLQQPHAMPNVADGLKGPPMGVPVLAAAAPKSPSYGIPPSMGPYGSIACHQQAAYPYALNNYAANLAACGGIHAAAAAVAAAAVAQQQQQLEAAAKAAGTPLYQGVSPYLGAPYSSAYAGGIPYSGPVAAAPYAAAAPSSSGTPACTPAPFTPPASGPYSPPAGPFSAGTPTTAGATPSPQTSFSGPGAVPFSPSCASTSPRVSPGREAATSLAVLHAASAATSPYLASTPAPDMAAGSASGSADIVSFASTAQQEYLQGPLIGAPSSAVFALPGSVMNANRETPGTCHGEAATAGGGADSGAEGSDWNNPSCAEVTEGLQLAGTLDGSPLRPPISATGLPVASSNCTTGGERPGSPEHQGVAVCAVPNMTAGTSFCQYGGAPATALGGLPGGASPAVSPCYVPASTYSVYPAAASHAVPVVGVPLNETESVAGRDTGVAGM